MITFREVVNLNECLDLWNREMGFIYPISDSIYKQNVIDYLEKLVYGAYEENQLVGFIIAKKFSSPSLISYSNLGFISLLYVSKKFRKRGIGQELLNKAEGYLSDKEIINVGKDINNFFPGVPCDFDNLTELWFGKRGYELNRYTHDLINRNPKKINLKEDQFLYKVCSLDEKESLLNFFSNNFPGRWFYEAFEYFQNGGTGNEYVVCLDENKVIAFARINDRSFKLNSYNTNWYLRFENLCGIGPLGVDKEYRGKNLGFNIVAYAINISLDRGKKEILIDWTGLLEFYQQFGFEVWKNYKYVSKNAKKLLQNNIH